jgi:anti-anti-sigma regulatory factor
VTDDDYVISDATELHGSTRRLRLAGAFHRVARADLQRAVLGNLGKARTVSLVIDLAAVTEICAVCVDVLLTGYTVALQRGHGFAVTNASGRPARALRRAGFAHAARAGTAKRSRRSSSAIKGQAGPVPAS